jgi:hypothetical protein
MVSLGFPYDFAHASGKTTSCRVDVTVLAQRGVLTFQTGFSVTVLSFALQSKRFFAATYVRPLIQSLSFIIYSSTLEGGTGSVLS